MTGERKKPPYGHPCNHCGQCCEAMLCPLGMVVFGQRDGPCPALSRAQDGGSVCGLVTAPAQYDALRAALYGDRAVSMAAYILIGAKAGCDALREDEPITREVQQARARFRSISAKESRRAHRAMKIWGISL